MFFCGGKDKALLIPGKYHINGIFLKTRFDRPAYEPDKAVAKPPLSGLSCPEPVYNQ
jgi:hypothetical protein